VIAQPELMSSAPMPDLAASAMNALAHAIESLYTPLASPVTDMAALRAAQLLTSEPPGLALGAILAGYSSGSAGFAVHHDVCQTIVRVAGTPHAQTNAVMLPHFVAMMRPRAPEALARLDDAIGPDGVSRLAAQSGVTRLSELGVERPVLDGVVAAAAQNPALGNTPDPPGPAELTEVLERAL
jgi:maleylacetate reductase